jgi:FtsP/CotA-like multicopper oxidase with cupredoxin domain
MTRLFWLLPISWLVFGPAHIARADWDDRPGFDFHPQTSAEAPCGVGTPPRGHFSGEVSPETHPQGITLLVKQDANRLCYVFGNVAEAPMMRVHQGAELKITLRNDITDPTAIARYVAIAHLDTPNAATPEAPDHYPVVAGMHHVATGMTNLHVHGFAVPPTVPQDEVMKTCVDPAVGPATCGRREFTYVYKVPETMPAGLYWYHPHVHGEVQAQMLMGLSGAIVVEGPDDDARRAAGIQDKVFIVRQAQDLDAKTSAPAAPDAAAPKESPMQAAMAHPMPVGTGNAVDTAHELACSSNTGVDQITLNGSKVINGKVQDSDLAHYEIADGSTQLWRFLNAATDAFLDLAIVDEGGTSRPITIVARDGAPVTDDAGKRLTVPPTKEAQLVPPGGRLEFLIAAPPVGRKAYLVTHAVDTGCAGDQVPERTLALITAAPTATPSNFAAPVSLDKDIPNVFTHLLGRKTDRERTIALAEYPRPGSEDQIDFYIAERKPGAVLHPYMMGDLPAITVSGGTTEEWVVENWTNELHAFHIHQIHFRLLDVNGKPEAEPPLLDVVNVPYATVRGAAGQTDITAAKSEIVPGRVRIKLFFPEELAGDIPFHCHLVDHEDNGMMAILRIAPRQASTGDDKKTELSPAELLANPPICRPLQAAMSVTAD